MKPFAVIDAASRVGTPAVGGGPVFEQALINDGVPYVTPRPSNASDTTRVYGQNAAEVINKYLKGGKAVYAGDDLKNQPRKVGVLYGSDFNIDHLEPELSKSGIRLAAQAPAYG